MGKMFKQIKLRITKVLFILLCMLVISCSEDIPMTLIDENVEALIATRSIERVMCVDAYVNDVFKGTHCWVVTGGVPSLPIGAIPSQSYRPNGYPASQGGGSFNQGVQWVFNFRQLQAFIGNCSGLNLLEKDMLNHVMELFISNDIASVYKDFYKYMKSIGLKVDYGVGAMLSEDGRAEYRPSEKRIEFADINAINFEVLIEMPYSIRDFMETA